jgi:hypothetical protein
LQSERVLALVVVVSLGGRRFVEFARGANRALAGIGPRKPGGHVPVQMVDSVRVFGVGLGQFAGEALSLRSRLLRWIVICTSYYPPPES